MKEMHVIVGFEAVASFYVNSVSSRLTLVMLFGDLERPTISGRLVGNGRGVGSGGGTSLQRSTDKFCSKSPFYQQCC